MLSLQTDPNGRRQRSRAFSSDEARWEAVQRRDAGADGVFFYSVRTTGVYCRPSCAARLPRRENVGFHTTPADAERGGFRPCKRCRPNATAPDLAMSDLATSDLAASGVAPAAPSIIARVAALDWARIAADLDACGCATTGAVLTPAECDALAASYQSGGLFRSRVIMARHGFGRGEYKYFGYPLPAVIAALREAFYPPLAEVANRWNARLDIARRFPSDHDAYLANCHAAGQTRPTPLLLQYDEGDYNCLHQDIYGEHVFPLQITFLLSRPGVDFTGGEFVLTEQRPRMQSRAEVVPLEQGGGVIFPVHHRPVEGARGVYRVTMRHGVSRLRSGRRHTAGIIFHDAK
jgi:uncharacterized protein